MMDGSIVMAAWFTPKDVAPKKMELLMEKHIYLSI